MLSVIVGPNFLVHAGPDLSAEVSQPQYQMSKLQLASEKAIPLLTNVDDMS